MSSPFPHRYRVGLVRVGQHAVLTDGVKPPINGGPPPEFGGSPQWWSPEHLLLAAANLCFTATFEAIASRAHLTVEGFESEITGVLDKAAAGPEFVSVTLAVSMSVATGQRELAELLLLSAKKNCIVANSLKPAVTLLLRIHEEAALPA
jgi:organic hydroperoxide reductase OsmC/OhrA